MQIDANLPKEQRILLAAEKVFSGRGYEKATVDEIIALADVGKGTVYKYFGNKEQLFYKLIADKNTIFIQRLQDSVQAAATLEEKLVAYIAEMIEFYRKNYGLWQVICFEMLGVSHGCRVIKRGSEYIVLSRYSNIEPSEELQEQILRYHSIMESEFIILYDLVNAGMQNGQIKNGYADIAARNFFWSVAMCVFNPTDFDMQVSSRDAAVIAVDRFLYGSAVEREQ